MRAGPSPRSPSSRINQEPRPRRAPPRHRTTPSATRSTPRGRPSPCPSTNTCVRVIVGVGWVRSFGSIHRPLVLIYIGRPIHPSHAGEPAADAGGDGGGGAAQPPGELRGPQHLWGHRRCVALRARAFISNRIDRLGAGVVSYLTITIPFATPPRNRSPVGTCTSQARAWA